MKNEYRIFKSDEAAFSNLPDNFFGVEMHVKGEKDSKGSRYWSLVNEAMLTEEQAKRAVKAYKIGDKKKFDSIDDEAIFYERYIYQNC